MNAGPKPVAERIWSDMKGRMPKNRKARRSARRPKARAVQSGSLDNPIVNAAAAAAATATVPSYVNVHSRAKWGTATQFQPDPDGPFEPIPARQPVTPFIDFAIDNAALFEIDGDYYEVEQVMNSAQGRQADLLILRGYEHTRYPERHTRRAMQVRYLEALIDQDRVDIPFLGTAKQWNLNRGWCLGGRTVASLGIRPARMPLR